MVQKMTYFFGELKHKQILAEDLEQAIRIFKASILYPEKYVDPKCIQKRGEYDNKLGRQVHTYKKNAFIPIYEDTSSETGWKKIGRVPLEECWDFDYSELMSGTHFFLEAPKQEEPKEAKGGLPIIGDRSIKTRKT